MACHRIIVWQPFMIAAAIRMRFNAVPPVPWEVVGEILRVSGSSVRYKFNERHRKLCLEIDRRRTKERQDQKEIMRAILEKAEAKKMSLREKTLVVAAEEDRIYQPKKRKDLIPYAGSKYDGRV